MNKLQAHLAHECERVDEEVKKKYLHIVAKRDGLDESFEITAFNANTKKIELTNHCARTISTNMI